MRYYKEAHTWLHTNLIQPDNYVSASEELFTAVISKLKNMHHAICAWLWQPLCNAFMYLVSQILYPVYSVLFKPWVDSLLSMTYFLLHPLYIASIKPMIHTISESLYHIGYGLYIYFP